MSTQYPNQYYAELAGMVIKSPSLALKQGEVCFYEGKAKSYQLVTKVKKKPKTKTSLFITPWFADEKTFIFPDAFKMGFLKMKE